MPNGDELNYAEQVALLEAGRVITYRGAQLTSRAELDAVLAAAADRRRSEIGRLLDERDRVQRELLVRGVDITLPADEVRTDAAVLSLAEARQLQERQGYGLGRLPALDPKDADYPMQAALRLPRAAVQEARERGYRMWFAERVLDQGNHPWCVAATGIGLFNAGPVRTTQAVDMQSLYRDCQRNDEWAGENYDGTSVRALFKVAAREGFIDGSYNWATSVQPVVDWVLNVGPVAFGTTWTTQMFRPDPYGYIWNKGVSAGGHAYLIIGVNRYKVNPDGTTGALRVLNSWGTSWGQRGRAWMSFGVADALIKDWGEAGSCRELDHDGKPVVWKAAA